MYLCGDIFYHSIGNASKDILNEFFESLKTNIKNEFINRDAQSYNFIFADEEMDKLENYQDIIIDSCFYNKFVPKNIDKEDRFLYLVTFQAVRIAALLHDIGHPPFSHITEHAINLAYAETKKKNDMTDREKLFVEILDAYCSIEGSSKKHQLHEELGNVMVGRIANNLIKDSKGEDFKSKYFIILSSQVAIYMLNNKNEFFKQLHTIIDGIIDGDRLDYVSRDVINSGFESGRIEYSRLISSMVLCKNKEDYIFTPDIKVLNTVEDFFFRRWKLYRTIIYHHRVIKTDHLLQDSIHEMIKQYLSKTEVEERKEKLGTIPNDISGLWKPLQGIDKGKGSNQRYFDALIQWDDGWLLSILKQHYFSKEYGQNTLLKYELEELLSNKKQFYSIIKDSNDFNRLDKVIIDNIEVDFNEVDKAFEGLDENCTVVQKRLKHICEAKGSLKDGYFLFNMKSLIENFLNDSYNFKDLTVEMIGDLIKQKYEDKIEEYFIEFKEPNYGLSKLPSIYVNKEARVMDKVSNIRELLQYDGRTFPVFFLYVKQRKESDFKYDIFIEDLGKEIARQWSKFFSSISAE